MYVFYFKSEGYCIHNHDETKQVVFKVRKITTGQMESTE